MSVSDVLLRLAQLAGTGIRRAGVGKLAKSTPDAPDSDDESALLDEFGFLRVFNVDDVIGKIPPSLLHL